MFEFLLGNADDAISLIIQDHNKVKDLFDRYEQAKTRTQKMEIARQTLLELKLHAVIEEEIFYPAIRDELEEDMMNEADEEHHVARFLVAELDEMDGSEDHYDAKYKVLAENIRHHIKEEEHEMLPKAKSLNIDFEAMGAKLAARKEQMLKYGIPTSREERMVQASGANDTPAANARRKKAAKSGATPKKTVSGAPAKKTPSGTARPPAAHKQRTKQAAKSAKNPPQKPKLKIVNQKAKTATPSSRNAPAKSSKRTGRK